MSSMRDMFAEWLPDHSPFESWSAPPAGVEVELQDFTMRSARSGRSRMSLSTWSGWRGNARTGGATPFETADYGTEGDVYEQARMIRLGGLVVEPSTRMLWERLEDLGSILTVPRYDVLTVHEPLIGLSRQLRVTRLDEPQITELSATVASYTLELEAPDARRLDITQQSVIVPAGGVDLVNAGKIPAQLSLSLVGPLTNPGLSWPGGAWAYSGSIPSGTTLYVDMERRVVRNPATSAHSRRLAAGDWLAVPVGRTRLSRTGSGAGSIRASWRSTWT